MPPLSGTNHEGMADNFERQNTTQHTNFEPRHGGSSDGLGGLPTFGEVTHRQGLRTFPDSSNQRGNGVLPVAPMQPGFTTMIDPAISGGKKRDRDSLFVPADYDEAQGNKRLRLNGPNTATTLTPPTLDKKGKVLPYDPKSEGRPQYAMFHQDFPKTERLASALCNAFLTKFTNAQSHGFSNDRIERICEGMKRRWIRPQERYPTVKPVALLGPAGVGKSSAINSLLHERDAAYENGSAGRGTNLVHQFSAPPADQVARYCVAAVYMTMKELSTFVQDHCDNIFAYLEKQHDDDDEDIDAFQAAYATAIADFRVILCHHPQFENDANTHDYFAARASQQERARDWLIHELDAVKKSRTINGTEYHPAHNVKELAAALRQVSRVATNADSRPHPWPIIKLVGIHTENALLDVGIVLADTPGVDDKNQTVVGATKNYLKIAGHVIVVEEFSRVNTKQTLNANLKEALQRVEPHNICLVITGIDKLGDMGETEREELADDDKEQIKQAEEAVELLNTQVSAAQSTAELLHLQQKMALAENKVTQAVIAVRTRAAARELRDRLRKIERSTEAPDLSIFFVANKDYRMHLTGYDPKKPPIHDVQATGIPALRQRLYEVPSRGKSDVLRRICTSRLPKIFKGINGILTKSPLEGKEAVRRKLDVLLEERVEIVDVLVSDLKQSFEDGILALMRADMKRAQGSAAALAGGWSHYKAMTFVAFCRRGGHWRTVKGTPMISWNELIQRIYTGKIDGAFDEFEKNLHFIEANLGSRVEAMFGKLKTVLEDHEDFQGRQGDLEYFEYIKHVCDDVMADIGGWFENMRRQFGAIRNAFVEDLPDSYSAQSMKPTYDQCLLISRHNSEPVMGPRGGKKSGAHPARTEVVRQKLTGSGNEPSVFSDIVLLAKHDFNAKIDAWKAETFTTAFEAAAEDICNEFEQRFDVPEEDVEEEHPETVEYLKKAVKDALTEINGPLKAYVDSWDRYEKYGY
ncbi:uncharacterized protein LTR77_002770 [Saxophila tyrrhenica]|uniref:DUF7605 domain-containing protein n=1 Tax=Saxophila tyrrhenica TaxID=1690608 RepID=A0AAV9PJZ9_9PEZI|nr:hypothetical protein LTR77_002770 [Saxophila tyrrhenica]